MIREYEFSPQIAPENVCKSWPLWRTSLPVASRPATCLFCLFISIEESPMQKILIIGYLGRDPELKYSPQGAVIAQFSIASTERWKDKNGDSRNAPSGSA